MYLHALSVRLWPLADIQMELFIIKVEINESLFNIGVIYVG